MPRRDVYKRQGLGRGASESGDELVLETGADGRGSAAVNRAGKGRPMAASRTARMIRATVGCERGWAWGGRDVVGWESRKAAAIQGWAREGADRTGGRGSMG